MSRTFGEFMSLCEASDGDAAKQMGWGGGASITRQGEGGRVGKDRKKSEPEIRRMKATGGGKMVPAKPYKPRKDIGQQRQTSTRVHAPQQERGSADVTAKAAAAAKEERKKAALARIAAKKKGETPSTTAKPKVRELVKTASKLLSTKKPEQPKSTTPKAPASGKTRAERDKERNAGLRANYNAEKQKALAGYKEVHGTLPSGKERTKLLAAVQKAHPPHPSGTLK